MQTATLAAGCFWGVEAKFRQLSGVAETRVGYTGGAIDDPDYKQVCTGQTGHAEAIQIEFDPEQISFTELLTFFWKMHNPTTPNRQGPDVGTQYRSAVFYHSESQREQAETLKQSLNQTTFRQQPIVTEITAAETFYDAEEYHQCYLEKKGLGSCH